MKKHLLALGLLLAGVSPAQALDVGDISSFMNSGSSTLSKTIKNSTDSGRLINIHLERLSSPLDGGQVIPMDKPDEVLLTPASLLLPAQASDVIRFFYKGPADDKERYYRIVWFDQALSDAQRDNANRSAVATASARIGTILVVAAPAGELSLSVRQRLSDQHRECDAADPRLRPLSEGRRW
ncbi:CFA/I fimbrial auxiliary subunit [Klebsiella pneumoniae]|uniref:CFA/I fimbrial auxiliary subunit n=1 Tax=Klebsiella pneumoniae TaxID=573 RepID=A0A2X3C0S1_KLEPN|nr:CFA/I fimbrial auxiliary subunit [Klebsiella pneumoniae]